jgi:hypothetical protein
LQVFEDASALAVRPPGHAAAVDAEHVEDHVRQRDRRVPLQQARAEQGEIGLAVRVERDQLAIEAPRTGSPARKAAWGVMSRPRRPRTPSVPSVDTIARTPSHLTS